MQHATGALASQSAVKILAPTYSFVGASTITDAATLYIDAAPTAGTNATITNPYVISAAKDTDASFAFGRAKMGSYAADNAYWSHIDQGTTTSYAIRQSNSGSTYFNTGAGSILNLSVGGTSAFKMYSSYFRSALGQGPSMQNENSTATNPTLLPNQASLTSGIGGIIGEVSIITGATEAVRWDASQNQINAGDIQIESAAGLYLDGATKSVQIHHDAGLIAFALGPNYMTLGTTALSVKHGYSSTVPRLAFAGGAGLSAPSVNALSAITNSIERQRWSANTAGLPVSTIQKNSVGTNIPRTNGYEYVALALRNDTAATAGPTHQNSPALSWEGSQWDTTNTAAYEFKWTAYAEGSTTALEGTSGTTWFLDVDGGVSGGSGGTALNAFNIDASTNMTIPTGNLWLSAGSLTVAAGAFSVNAGTSSLDRTIINQTASALSLPPAAFYVTYGAHTTMGNTQNHPHVHFAFDQNNANWDGVGTAALQAAFQIDPPTYVATAATQTITEAATVYISGAPVASTNVAITNPYALFVDAGDVRLDGHVIIGDGTEALPGLSFGADTDTGIRRVATNSLALVTGATDHLNLVRTSATLKTATFTGQVGSDESLLTSAASVTTDCRQGNGFFLDLNNTGITMSNPTNGVAGFTYTWRIKQKVASRTVTTWGTAFLFPGGVPPTLSTAVNSVDLLTAYYDGTSFLCSFQADYK